MSKSKSKPPCAHLPAHLRFVLASASPRRAELLREAGYMFETLVSPVEEPSRRPTWVPLDVWPTALAFMKAFAVQQKLADPTALVLGADTIVFLNGRIMNKPRDRTHARQMLQRLSGQTHQVITGLALLHGPEHRFSRGLATCRIRKLSERFLKNYLDSNLWRGKAGAYGIQDHQDPWVQLLDGEWSTVVGLPMELLRTEIAGISTGLKRKA